VVLGAIALMMLPILIAIIFTIWAGTRPTVATPTAAPS
jgi:hypothetical protein